MRLSNLRTTHFSRNPKIANVLHEYGFVREFGEGISRIYREMSEAGLPAPIFKQDDFMLRATIMKTDRGLHRLLTPNEGTSKETDNSTSNSTSNSASKEIVRLVSVLQDEMSIHSLMESLNFKSRPMFINGYLKPAIVGGFIETTQPHPPKSPTQKYRLTPVGEKLKQETTGDNNTTF